MGGEMEEYVKLRLLGFFWLGDWVLGSWSAG